MWLTKRFQEEVVSLALCDKHPARFAAAFALFQPEDELLAVHVRRVGFQELVATAPLGRVRVHASAIDSGGVEPVFGKGDSSIPRGMQVVVEEYSAGASTGMVEKCRPEQRKAPVEVPTLRCELVLAERNQPGRTKHDKESESTTHDELVEAGADFGIGLIGKRVLLELPALDEGIACFSIEGVALVFELFGCSGRRGHRCR